MDLTAKEEYGLRAVMYLAANEPSWPIQSREIAVAERIPEQFLEQVLASLRRAGIARSIRGASGGYQLARTAAEITAGDIVRALSGPITTMSNEEQDQAAGIPTDAAVVADLRRRVQSAICTVLDGTTIRDMVDDRVHRQQVSSFMMNI